MNNNKFENNQEDAFYVKVYSSPMVKTSKEMLIELDDKKGIINIGDGVEEVDNYPEKKEAIKKLLKKTQEAKLANMEIQLKETIAKYGAYPKAEKYIHVKFNGKEYKLNFATNLNEKQSKYYVSFINALFKIL